MLEYVVYYLIAMNFAAFAAFGIDKMLAEAQAWRISEATLLQLAFFGGTPGAYAGRAMFRHKTRKVSFTERLHALTVLQVFLLVLATLEANGVINLLD